MDDEHSLQSIEGFHFLDLPAETRNHIYHDILVSDNATFWLVDYADKASSQPPLLRTCRQIRQEAMPLFYANNHFTAFVRDAFTEAKSEALVAWLSNTPAAYINSIKGLTIRIDPDGRYTHGALDRLLTSPLVDVALTRGLTMDGWVRVIRNAVPEESSRMIYSVTFRQVLRSFEDSMCGERVEH